MLTKARKDLFDTRLTISFIVHRYATNFPLDTIVHDTANNDLSVELSYRASQGNKVQLDTVVHATV